MFNHARTLLLNRSGSAFSEAPGEQAVPPDFKELVLPTYLTDLRSRLFGSDPDRAMLNYRLAQFMPLLHVTELEEYVLDLDPRVTYLNRNTTALFDDATFTPAVRAESGSARGFAVIGQPLTPDDTGKMYHRVRVASTSGQPTVALLQSAPKPKAQNVTPSTDGTLFVGVDLFDAGYQAMVPQDGGVWFVSWYARPQWDVGQLAESAAVSGESTLLQLFGTKLVEPYLTFSNLFFQHRELAYRLGGLLMAMIYRTEEVRRSVNG